MSVWSGVVLYRPDKGRECENIGRRKEPDRRMKSDGRLRVETRQKSLALGHKECKRDLR